MVDNQRFYRKNAHHFFERTAYLEVESLYQDFLPLLSVGAQILDAGCGSGRDTKAFAERGYRVSAFDATPELVELARQFTGQPIRLLRFQEMDYAAEFDGIWASASLLHVPLAELPKVVERFITALKPGGYWYMSFKYGGSFEAVEKRRGERLFTDFSEVSLPAFLAGFTTLQVVNLTVRADDRFPGNDQERWVCAVVRKRGDANQKRAALAQVLQASVSHSPTRNELLAELEALRAMGAFDSVISLSNKFANTTLNDLSDEELLATIHETATEWGTELDELFGADDKDS